MTNGRKQLNERKIKSIHFNLLYPALVAAASSRLRCQKPGEGEGGLAVVATGLAP